MISWFLLGCMQFITVLVLNIGITFHYMANVMTVIIISDCSRFNKKHSSETVYRLVNITFTRRYNL